MKDKLRNYIEKVFEDAPKTKKIVDLKEEILQNITDKYDDLIAEGKSEEAAYNLAIANMGDVTELIDDLTEENVKGKQINQTPQIDEKKSALIMAVAIMLYITCVVPVLILQNEIGVVGMFMFIGIATALLIYNSKLNKKYKRTDDSVVEEFKEWSAEKSARHVAKKQMISAMWALITAIYFVISFCTDAWEVTWVIFIIGKALSKIIEASFELKDIDDNDKN